MVQCQLMLVHLRQDGTYIQMDLTRVRYLKTLLHISLTLVQTCILYVQRLLQVVQSIPQLVRLLEETRVIVVSNGSKSLIVLSEHLCLCQEVLRYFVVLLVHVVH